MLNARKVENKRAYFDYDVIETVEVGLVLSGQEVKAFRAGKVSLNAAFVRPLQSGSNGRAELWLINALFAGTVEQDKSRKLLIHRHELDRLIGKIVEKGLTLIPLEMYFTRGKLKLQVGLARGKKQYEKREVIKRQDLNREMRRAARN